MIAAAPTGFASLAIAEVLELLADAGVPATGDAGALVPDPIGVLVGLPALTGRTLAGSSYDVPVTIVTGDPLSSAAALDRFYGVADAAADALRVASYSPSTFTQGVNAERLTSIELVASVTLSRLNGGTSYAPD